MGVIRWRPIRRLKFMRSLRVLWMQSGSYSHHKQWLSWLPRPFRRRRSLFENLKVNENICFWHWEFDILQCPRENVNIWFDVMWKLKTQWEYLFWHWEYDILQWAIGGVGCWVSNVWKLKTRWEYLFWHLGSDNLQCPMGSVVSYCDVVWKLKNRRKYLFYFCILQYPRNSGGN